MDLKNEILQTETGKQLSEYQLNLLKKNGIETISDFYEEDEDKLKELLAIRIETLRELKSEMALLTNPFNEESILDINYGTGLEELDKLLVNVEQQFKPGRVWEICGPTGVGKTQLMYTLMVNFVWKHNLQALFIDLKRDFSSKRIGDMLAARETDSGSCERVLKAIRVAEATTSRELIEMLQNFYQQLAASNKDAQRTKLVVIDSLPECFYSFRGKKMAMLRKSLITELACSIRKLSVHGIAFVVGNMSFFQKEEETVNDDGEDDGGRNEEVPVKRQLDPMLGDHWGSVCTLRLSVEMPIVWYDEQGADRTSRTTSKDNGIRLVNVISNTYGPVGGSCRLRITEAGVV
ncbi:uncharacterized protein Dana_GF13728 [Drosophila ananassae]|uniref:Rad51-like C-terminal domain-containing protein n=1 Tax=Drosophila ananassae TaxID=7217 RepID=B3MHI2_DROAN|nr:DNA repair protein RAD51 homolog 4 [Drosophila ananassae]EDV37982.2 uncharacterized protein Dana_GF13728 [Drosophila ananassae]